MLRLFDLFLPRKNAAQARARHRSQAAPTPKAERVALSAARETGDWTRVRTPANPRDEKPTDVTLAWAASLPLRARPKALLAKYARVANRLALCWSDPALSEVLLDDLLVDKRGNRKGFPIDVVVEIKALYDLHHARGGGRTDSPWASNSIAVGDR